MLISTALPAGAHFGEVVRARDFGALIVAESRYRPRLQTPIHHHQTASFTLLVRGSYVERLRRHQLECGAGSILFRPAQEAHRDLMGAAGADCVMIEMPRPWLRRMQEGGLRLDAPRQRRDGRGFAARIRRELTLADDCAAVALEALAMELACDFERSVAADSRPPRWLRQVRDRIDSQFAELPTLDALALDAGIHPAHLARSFRRHFGCTVGEYARKQRIAFCSEQLRNSHSSLSHIGAAAGFSSQAHFHRVFKLHTGLTPTEFRRLSAP